MAMFSWWLNSSNGTMKSQPTLIRIAVTANDAWVTGLKNGRGILGDGAGKTEDARFGMCSMDSGGSHRISLSAHCANPAKPLDLGKATVCIEDCRQALEIGFGKAEEHDGATDAMQLSQFPSIATRSALPMRFPEIPA